MLWIVFLKVVCIYINAFETSENIFNNEHDKFNLSKTNSNRSICLCISCTKKGDGLHIMWDSTMKVKILVKVYEINEIFHQEWSTSQVSFSNPSTMYRYPMIHISVTKIVSVATLVCSIITEQEWTPASEKRICLQNISTLRMKIRKENVRMYK